MKTLSLETAKRLQGHLKDVETEKIFFKGEYQDAANNWHTEDEMELVDNEKDFEKYKRYEYGDEFDDFRLTIIKTLTLEEAIEFLPIKTDMPKYWRGYLRDDVSCHLAIEPKKDHWEAKYTHWNMGAYTYQAGKTPLEAIEKMINYLLDNKLI